MIIIIFLIKRFYCNSIGNISLLVLELAISYDEGRLKSKTMFGMFMGEFSKIFLWFWSYSTFSSSASLSVYLGFSGGYIDFPTWRFTQPISSDVISYFYGFETLLSLHKDLFIFVAALFFYLVDGVFKT